MTKKALVILADRELRAQLTAFAQPLGDAAPEQMLLAMVSEAAGNVAYLGARVDELSRKEPEAGPNTQPVGRARALAGLSSGDKGSGLFGPTIAVDRDGREHVTGEEYRAATRLYGEWADRLVKYSKAALDAGIAQQQLDLAKSQGQTLVVIVNRVLVKMGLDEAKQTVARQLLAEEFRELSGAGEAEELVGTVYDG